MIKKIIIYLILLIILLPITTNALETLDTVYIKDITVDDISSNASYSNLSYKGRDINLELKFKEIGDYIRFKVTIKNSDMEDYLINDYIDEHTSNYVTYKYEVGNSNYLKHGEEKTIYLTATYTKKIEDTSLNPAGMFIENNNPNFKLYMNSINVPDTYKGINVVGMFAIITLIIIGIILIIKERKKEGTMVFLFILLIPFNANALNEIKLNINADIRIVPDEEKLCFIKEDNRIFTDEEYYSYDEDQKLDSTLFNIDVDKISFIPRKILDCKKNSIDDEEESICIMEARFDNDYNSCMDSEEDKSVCYTNYLDKVLEGNLLDSYYGCYYEK